MNYIDLTNETNGSSYTPSQISSFGMPSSIYEDIIINPSGSTYTAPANGWVCVMSPDGNTTIFVDETGNGKYLSTNSPIISGLSGGACYAPLRKNNSYIVKYDGTLSDLRFFYAEGEV